ncbi:MAG TPA: META domain-containing protein [Firmicutes bacterium]|nr:META domain-containing protein [Bacillota bacterium]
MYKVLIFCFISTFVGFGCEKENLTDADLTNNIWELISIQDTQTKVMTEFPSDAPENVSIFFSDTSNIVGFNGICNGGAGTYTLTDNSGGIEISDVFGTLVGCKYGEWETYTIQNLLDAYSYEINGNDLKIYSHGDYNLYFTTN